MANGNGIATVEHTPPSASRLPALTAGATVRAIVPQSIDEAWRIAKAVTAAGAAPRGLETPEKCMIAIMHGLEVGMTPMAAIQSIAIINNRPVIYGDGAIGLARGSGKLEWMKETFEGKDDAYKAVCVVHRRGEPEPVSGEFSVADAKKAALWGKAGPWQQYPKRMLRMRARAFVLRDVFADVLKGLGIREEVEDIAVRDITPRDEPPAPPPIETAAATIASEPEAIEPPPPAPPPDDLEIPPALRRTDPPAARAKPSIPNPAEDPEGFLKWADKQLAVVVDPTALEIVWNDIIEPRMDGMFPPDQEECLALWRKHEARLAP